MFDLSWSLNENFLKEIILINQNYYDQKKIYPNEKITCAQTKMYGIWCLEFQIFAYLTLNKRYFLANEKIEFLVKINNPSSKPILKLTANLVKQIKCFNGKKETDFEVILDQKEKMVHMLLAEDQKEKKEKAIQNVYHLLKPDQCQKVKDVQQLQEKEQQEILDQNQLMLQHLQKEKELQMVDILDQQ